VTQSLPRLLRKVSGAELPGEHDRLALLSGN
jgi:hypothetical protein